MTTTTLPHALPVAAGTRAVPHLRHERALLREGAVLVAGMDEVGRGSLAGPVSVGVVVVDATTRSAPRGVADSKLLTPAARQALLPALSRWGLARAVGHASAAEIDDVGIIVALRRAGTRALAQVTAAVGPVDVVLLDGSHDWLTPPADLFAADDETAAGLFAAPAGPYAAPAVRLRVKADRTCASVAAASVLAKCERDTMMVALAAAHPAYHWEQNKGYASPEHVTALAAHGPCSLHRRAWSLPGVGPCVVEVAGAPGASGAVPLPERGAALWAVVGLDAEAEGWTGPGDDGRRADRDEGTMGL